MRNISMFLIIFLIFSVSLHAQKDIPPRENHPISMGPYFAIKGGVNTSDVPEGIQNGFNFGGLSDFGACFYVPFKRDQKMGLLVDLTYSSYTYNLNLYDDDQVEWTNDFSYVSIAPMLYYGGFLIGFNLGFPDGASSDESSVDAIYDADDMAMAFFGRMGASLTLFEDENVWINLDLRADYMLTGLFNEADTPTLFVDGDPYSFEDYNPHPVSISLGFSVMINFEKNEKYKVEY